MLSKNARIAYLKRMLKRLPEDDRDKSALAAVPASVAAKVRKGVAKYKEELLKELQQLEKSNR